MPNCYSVLVGFMKDEPKMVERTDTQEQVCIFTIVTSDNGRTNKEISCMATGMICQKLLGYGLKGTLWAVGGTFYNLMINKSKKKILVLKCLEIELLHQPKIPGISLKEFIDKYRPKEIIERARKIKDAKVDGSRKN